MTFGLAVLLFSACAPPQHSNFDAGTAGGLGTPKEDALLVQKGEPLYRANCQSCHGGPTGGKMMDLPPPHNANGHTWHHPDCQLKEIILNGSGEMGEIMRQMMGATEKTPKMPTWKGILSDDDVSAVLAYIKSMWTQEQREFQAKVTQTQCKT